MNSINSKIDQKPLQEKKKFNLAIVGGGRACKFFLDLLAEESFPYLDIRIKCVCDINPKAQGMLLAQKMGIPTMDNFKKLFEIKDLDAVIELTNSKALPELIAMRPERVGVIEHNIGRLLRYLFEINQKLMLEKRRTGMEKGYYDILFKQSNLGVVVLDRDFTIVDANDVYLRAVRKTGRHVIGKKCHEVVKGFFAPCPATEPGFECPLIKTLETGTSSHIIHDYPVSKDKTAYFNIATYPVRDQNNEIFRVIELWRDITSEMTQKWANKVKRLEADMKKIIQEDRLVSLGKLVASSVHEINNPIQGLLTFSYMMEEMIGKNHLETEDIEKFKMFLPHMTRELERCGQIVSGLLAFSRESPLEFIGVDVNTILDSVISLTSHKLALSNIALKTEIFPKPLLVYGDCNQLQQCFLNLIFNSIEAMPDGGEILISTETTSQNNNNKVKVQINDNGIGISKKDMEHIFDPFFTTKAVGEGTGLGLSIVYGIIKEHDGTINVDSTPGLGTSFTILLPQCKGMEQEKKL